MRDTCFFVVEPFVETCPEAKAKIEIPEVSGRMTFDANGQYSLEVTGRGSLDSQIPRSCLKNGDCTQLEKSTPGTSCLASSTTCTCTRLLEVGQAGIQRGGYTIQGQTLMLENDRDGDYCVMGDELMFGDTMVMKDMQGEDKPTLMQFKLVRE